MGKKRSPILAIAVLPLLVAGLMAPASTAAVGDATDYSIGAGATPYGVTLGPDGNIWIAAGAANSIVRVSPTGAIAAFALPSPNSNPRFITVGSDRNLWFTQQSGNRIGRITLDGSITEFAVPTANAEPFGIAAGPDGNLWFTQLAGNKIARITPTGVITEFVVPTANSAPWGITAAPGGASQMFFTQQAGNKIGSVDMSGNISEIPLAAGSNPQGISAVGNDLWFAESGTNKIARLVGSTALEITLPGGSQPAMIAEGPGTSMWVTLTGTNQVLRMTNAGAIQNTFALPAGSAPLGLNVGSDANMWIALSGRAAVARMLTGQVATNTQIPTFAPTTGLAAGTVLTATPGQWSYAPSSYTYVWQRCTTAEATSCSDSLGSVSTYTVQPADVGQFLRVIVSAVNANGTSQGVPSALVQVGSAPSPTPTPQPAVATTTTVDGPTAQKRTKRKRYTAVVSGNAVGTVTFTFTRKKRSKTFANVPVVNGTATVRWKVGKKWPVGPTRITATFTPATPNDFTGSSGQGRVRIRP
jgi:virginiamycin B lyase